MKLTAILASAEPPFWLIAYGVAFVLAIILFLVLSAVGRYDARRKLRRADESAQRGDWTAAAAYYKKVLSASLTDEDSVKLCVSKLENAYRQLGVKADLSRIYEFHRLYADIFKATTISNSERKNLAQQSLAELENFLAKYP